MPLELLKELLSELKEIRAAIEKLGVNDADMRLGAIELLAREVKNLSSSLTVSLDNLNDTITHKE